MALLTVAASETNGRRSIFEAKPNEPTMALQDQIACACIGYLVILFAESREYLQFWMRF
ncbi:hypothetical protein [Bradyrhizobium sp. dw_411]|uniref:hypothetical protein n=1 Tax=Bradyrhizobium sp. dw_411 TaxID=2720082 RepID=UPI001BCE1DAE|nr:hypothetical protein [Bradyrhizobium sp. dw_411]